MDWITGRLKEPTTYLAIALAGVGLGILFTMPILTWAGIIGGIFGFVLKEKAAKAQWQPCKRQFGLPGESPGPQ